MPDDFYTLEDEVADADPIVSLRYELRETKAEVARFREAAAELTAALQGDMRRGTPGVLSRLSRVEGTVFGWQRWLGGIVAAIIGGVIVAAASGLLNGRAAHGAPQAATIQP